MSGDLSYVLVTPARNEEAYIEKTIQAVISQSILPKKWVIVSDGSTDRTEEIVSRHLADNSWMELVRMPESRDRNFAAKAVCFNAGYEIVKNAEYDIIGNLDADISFEPGYFEFLLDKFSGTPELGVAGTPFVENGFQYDYRFVSIEHVSGACQLFRRRCFEDIGGYIPIKGGGVDWTAVTTARMKGWKTRTFTEKTCMHHRKIGTGKSKSLLARFRFGKQDYYLGGHPVWEIFRCIYQMKLRPYVIGGVMILSGYLWAGITRMERPISPELVRFRRKEQMQRLASLLGRVVRFRI
ncbi:MAG TPA: glycosyltransferase family 2 protein [Dissulfurispiraceae bacterium]